jgi:hypothetical protein
MMMNINEIADHSAHALITEAWGDMTMNYTFATIWKEALRILHPGAYALILATGPTPSLIAIDMRKTGFEFRDTISVFFAGRWTPCFVFRKPIAEKTVAQQVLATSTGALNIDACRVKHASAADLASHQAMVAALKAKGGSLGNSWKNSSDLANANEVKEGGRWPGNLLLVHAAGCHRVGETKRDAPVINRFDSGMKPFGHGAGHSFSSTQTGDAEGKETVAVYDCRPGCPVQGLDQQSGALTSGTGAVKRETAAGHQGNAYGAENRAAGTEMISYGDSGGASRFFSQFECTESCPVKGLDDQSGILHSAMGNPGVQKTNEAVVNFNGKAVSDPGRNQHGDTGGASRFFSQFECTPECPVAAMNDASGELKSGELLPGHKQGQGRHTHDGGYVGGGVIEKAYGGDSGGAARFFSQFEASPELFAWLKSLALPPGAVLLDLSRGLVQDVASEPESAA